MGILSLPVGPHAIFTITKTMQEGFQYEAWIKKRANTGRARSSKCKGEWALSPASQTLAFGHAELIHGQATRSMQTSKAEISRQKMCPLSPGASPLENI